MMEPKRILLRSGDQTMLVDRIVEVETRTIGGGTILIEKVSYRMPDRRVVEAKGHDDHCFYVGFIWFPESPRESGPTETVQ